MKNLPGNKIPAPKKDEPLQLSTALAVLRAISGGLELKMQEIKVRRYFPRAWGCLSFEKNVVNKSKGYGAVLITVKLRDAGKS